MATALPTATKAIYELSINARVAWQAHSLSNAGSNGSNRLYPRHQLLATGEETDACSGSIAKHYHAQVFAEYAEAAGCPLCLACQERDGRRAAAPVVEHQNLTIEQVIQTCAVCDTHGFLVTAKNVSKTDHTPARQRQSKHTLIDFSFALALPERHQETSQLFTRIGDTKEEGQMLMKMTARSGEYAICVRYKCAGIGLDTDKWHLCLADEEERVRRYRAALSALSDYFLSPQGALTATMLPHLTALQGAIVLRTSAGRAPMYSGLVPDFVERLRKLVDDEVSISSFETIDTFREQMQALIHSSTPALPARFHDDVQKKTQARKR
jgi:CRISPR-associated autoregulator DevR family